MLIITDTFIQQHEQRILEVTLAEAEAFIKTDRDMHHALGVLYEPIINKEWDYKSKTFCGGEISSKDVLRLAFFFAKNHYDGVHRIEGNAKKVTELHNIYVE